MRIIGINKYGIKLEDHADYASYKRAIKNAAIKAYHKTPKGQLAYKNANTKYAQTEKGKINSLKRVYTYRKTKQGRAFHRSSTVKCQAAKMNRIPKWADLKAIQQFYYNCPEGYEVDHIVPLNGENVSGLHVLSNLQYLTKVDNIKKGNTWICSS